eukprot:2895641-Pyramimonas_sp.AAC.1
MVARPGAAETADSPFLWWAWFLPPRSAGMSLAKPRKLHWERSPPPPITSDGSATRLGQRRRRRRSARGLSGGSRTRSISGTSRQATGVMPATKVNKVVGDRKSLSQLRYLATEKEQLDISTDAARDMMKGREILRIIAIRATARQGRGQVCARGPCEY